MATNSFIEALERSHMPLAYGYFALFSVGIWLIATAVLLHLAAVSLILNERTCRPALSIAMASLISLPIGLAYQILGFLVVAAIYISLDALGTPDALDGDTVFVLFVPYIIASFVGYCDGGRLGWTLASGKGLKYALANMSCIGSLAQRYARVFQKG